MNFMQPKGYYQNTILLAVITAGILAFDLNTPLGTAAAVPYIIVMVVAAMSRRTSNVIAWACCSTFLTILGYYLSPLGSDLTHVLSNRLLSLLAIWSIVVLHFHFEGINERIMRLEQEVGKENELTHIGLVAKYTRDAVVITDKDGLVTWVNDGFTAISGYTLEDMKGEKPSSRLQGRETSLAEVQRISEELKRGETVHTEIINYHKNGTKYWVDIIISPITVNGVFEKFIAVERDITNKKTLEQNAPTIATTIGANSIQSETPESIPATAIEAENTATTTEHNEKVLIAEDNKINTLVLTKMLKSLGYTNIDVAVNGARAVEMASKETYSAILMDNHMPEMNGTDATKAILQEKSIPTIVIACTADARPEVIDSFIKHGAKQVLLKPIKKAELQTALEEHSTANNLVV